jgi:hypothetical protein
VVLVVKRGVPFRRADYVPITAAEAGEAPADEADADEAH